MSTDKGIAFFFEHAGYSWNPKTETQAEGRQRCAEKLAGAELWARLEGYSFDWRADDRDSSEWSDEEPAWKQWACCMFDEHGECVQSLGGVDFGREGEPWGDSYRRVVEAELALEQMP